MRDVGPGDDESAAAELRRLRALVGLVATCTWHAAADGGFAVPQPAWQAYSGQDWAAHRGFGWADAVHPEDRGGLLALWRKAVAGTDGFGAAARVWHAATGDWRPIVVRAVPWCNADGSPGGWVGMLADGDDRWHAETALRAGENRYRRAVTSAAVPIMLHAEDGEVLAVSDGLLAATGYGRDQLRRFETWLNLAYADRAGEVGDRVRRRFAESLPIPGVELEVRTATGEIRTWIWTAPPPEPLADGRRCIFAIASDVTETKLATAALQASEERYRLAVAAVDGIVYDWDLVAGTVDRSERIVDVVGIPADRIPPDPSWWEERIHPDDVAPAMAEGARLQDGDAARMQIEYRVRHADGSWVDVVDHAFLVRDTFGKVARIVGVTTNVTAGRRAEQALRDSEERLRLARDAARIGIHDYDVVSGCLRWDARMRELWAIDPDRPVDYALFMEGVHPEDRAMVQGVVAGALDPGGGPYAIEFRVVGIGDGLERWIAATGQVSFAGRCPTRLVGTVLDVTERKRTEAELRALVRQRDMLLRELHHRVRNNLQLVSSLLRLQANRHGGPMVRSFVGPAVRRIEAIGATYDILNRAQLSGRVALCEHVRTLCLELAASFADPGIGLRVEVPACDTEIDSDRAIHLGLILNELVTNAFKHGHAGTSRQPVRVTLEPFAEARWSLVVANRHPPLGPDGGDTRSVGSGFGLELIGILSRQLDGRITVDPGETYSVRLDFGL